MTVSQVAAPGDVRPGLHVQDNIRWELFDLSRPLPGDDGSECRKLFRLPIRARFRGQVGRLHDHVWFVV